MKHKILIYQVLPRLFGNNTFLNKPNGNLAENGCGKFAAFTTKALKEIKNMGITHIWYTGVIEHSTQTDYSSMHISRDHTAIIKGKAGSPYAIKDYYDVDPDLAINPIKRMEEFQALINRTHRVGLKVIMDFVPNHVARQYHSDAKPSIVDDFGKNDDTNYSFSPQNNFYYIPEQKLSGIDLQGDENAPYTEYPAKATGNDHFDAYLSNNDWYETVKLNYGVDYLNYRHTYFNPIPNTWHKMLEILLYWAGKKVDAFRCDMAEMVPVEFWGWVIPLIKKQYPAVLFIAEIYNPNEYRNYIFNGKFDFLYDKEGLYNTLRAITCTQTCTYRITDCWQNVDGIQDKMLAFMENHDEQRIASDYFAGHAKHGLPGMIVCATMNVNPAMIYFGQELGEKGMDCEGFSGRDGRTTIFDYWNVSSISNWINHDLYDGSLLSQEQKDLKSFYTKVLTIANTEKAISEGSFFDLMYVNTNNPSMNGKQYVYARKKDNDLILIAANFCDATLRLQVQLPLHFFECMEIPLSGKVKVKNLLSGEENDQILSSSVPFIMEVNNWSGNISKIILN